MIDSIKKYDLVIVGGGFSGSSLALRLKKNLSHLSILILEKNKIMPRKLGESTSDLTAIYLRRMGIDHLLKKHTPKTGLRFLFKNASELSSPSRKSITNGFHLNRSQFDEDMLDEAKKYGVEILREAIFRCFEEGENDCKLVHYSIKSSDYKISTKWLVDASGKRGVIGRNLGWIKKEEDLKTAATWGHFTNTKPVSMCAPCDHLEWDKMAIGPIENSTIHFLGDHYWWWHIRLSKDLVSIGLVYDSKKYKGDYRDIFSELKKDHPLVCEVLEKGESEKLHHLPHLSYYPTKIYSKGVLLVGESCGFPDPLFSPGMELVCQQVEWLSTLLEKTFRFGHNEKEWVKYEKRMIKGFKDRIFVYRKRYEILGNYFSFCSWTMMDFFGYYCFHVLPAVYFPPLLKYPVKLSFFLKLLYGQFVRFYTSKNRKTSIVSSTESKNLTFSRLWVPKLMVAPIKIGEIFFVWLKCFILALLK